MGKQEELSLYSTPYFHAGILYRSSPTVKTNRFSLQGLPLSRETPPRQTARGTVCEPEFRSRNHYWAIPERAARISTMGVPGSRSGREAGRVPPVVPRRAA